MCRWFNAEVHWILGFLLSPHPPPPKYTVPRQICSSCERWEKPTCKDVTHTKHPLGVKQLESKARDVKQHIYSCCVILQILV